MEVQFFSLWDGDLSDDQRALIDIEKNIANIERSMSANHIQETDNRHQVSKKKRERQRKINIQAFT